jgi:hypothetical protein
MPDLFSQGNGSYRFEKVGFTSRILSNLIGLVEILVETLDTVFLILIVIIANAYIFDIS